MGLDQWLYAKTTKRELNNHTGVCSGLFNMIPAASNGMIEIGYWRKAYDQEDVIYKLTHGREDSQGNLPITLNEVIDILETAEYILNNHNFDEDSGEDLTHYDVWSSSRATWQSMRKWSDTVKFFTEAKQILKEDPEAKIYYHRWA